MTEEQIVGVSQDPPDGSGKAPSSTREQIEEIINNAETMKDEIKEEVKQEEIKLKSKPTSKAKPKVKIIKQPVQPVQPIEEVVEQPVVEEVVVKPKVDKLKEMVKCPDCNLEMTVHILKYIHKRRGFCKAGKVETKPVETKPVETKPFVAQANIISENIVNDYIKQNPDIVNNYLRNERAMEAQKKQMNARTLLNNAFLKHLFNYIIYKRWRTKRKQPLELFSLIS